MTDEEMKKQYALDKPAPTQHTTGGWIMEGTLRSTIPDARPKTPYELMTPAEKRSYKLHKLWFGS